MAQDSPPPRPIADPAFMALVRKLHAAELQHLRDVVAEQQALIEDQARQIRELERAADWADQRADMLQDACNDLQQALPHARIGLHAQGILGVLS